MAEEAINYQQRSESLDAARMRASVNSGEKDKKSDSTENTQTNETVSKRGKVGDFLDNAKKAQKIAKTASPGGFIFLLKEVRLLSDMPYVAAVGAALLKDLVDAVASETVILGALFSVLCTIFIFMMMLLAGSNGKRKQAKSLIKKGIILVTGGVIDAVPIIGWFPAETITACLVYGMVLMERRMEKD